MADIIDITNTENGNDTDNINVLEFYAGIG